MEGELRTAAQVLAHEKNALGGQGPFSGLAFSGGGIRSAAFGMGILQAIHGAKLLKKIDYLSTVSGGGYLGASLTWFLNGKDAEDQYYNTSTNFPFPNDSKASDNTPLQFIQQHCKYPTPEVHGLDFISFIGIIIRGMITSLFVYSGLLIFAFSCLVLLADAIHPMTSFANNPHTALGYLFLTLALFFAFWFFVQSLFFDLGTHNSSDSSKSRYSSRTRTQGELGRIMTVGSVFLVLATLPFIHLLFVTQMESVNHNILSMVLVLIGSVLGYRHKARGAGAGSSVPSSANTTVIFSFLFIYALLVLTYSAAQSLLLVDAMLIDYYGLNLTPGTLSAPLLFLIATALGWTTNLNYSSLNRMYRDRLMEAFMPDKSSVAVNRWGFADEANKANISTMCQTPDNRGIKRPYHLLNATIVIADSTDPKYRSRHGDSFLLSPMFVGSDATGYSDSKTYMTNRGGLSLATAMSISGAALNPNAGGLGEGPAVNRVVATLLALLNLRMGFWAAVPGKISNSIPNYIKPGLAGGILSTSALSGSGDFVELADGGGFDNLGLYELFRRQLTLIIAYDGGEDADYSFTDLANSIERARTDFGVEVNFKGSLSELLPGSSTESKEVVEKYALAKRGYAVAEITYDNKQTGTLIYMKATMVPCLPIDVLGYKNDNPSFPNQSTVDQFFDEAQFEAYRQLGLHIANTMVSKLGKEYLSALNPETEDMGSVPQ